MKALLGRKIGMTQVFQENKVIPVTLIQTGPCRVLETKTKEKDGYQALQLGFEDIKRPRKSQKGKEVRFIKEFRMEGELPLQGSIIDSSVFQAGDLVQVSSVSKGKGFQGGVKRWGFAGRDATHGTKHEERTLGSTGSQQPQRVSKGKKMPGRMGSDRVTIVNLSVVHVDVEKQILGLKGAVPGAPGTVVEIRTR
ncbi:MAG: 50S ribosomal protein L3 [bacterium]|nr:50S ribosomal protein L3 [bacterium]